MRKTPIDANLELGRTGLGCMSMTGGYAPATRDDRESIQVVHRALDLGVALFDTADIYGPFSNEQLLGRALRGRRDRAVIATKCGLVPGPDGALSRDGRPEHIRAACEGSLRRLGVDVIDLYQLHRVDPAVPLEETWGAMADLVAEGKVRALGISHATVPELALVHSLFPLAAVQYELSILAPQLRADVLPWCQANGVAFVAFAPIGRGYLTGGVDGVGVGDSRSSDPRFTADALAANRPIVEGVRSVAERVGATPAQVAIAWVLAQGDRVVPIPGTRTLRRLEENVAALDVRLGPEDLRELDALPVPTGRMQWDRWRSTDNFGRRVGAR
ncbi:aldo/keto reductase [Saccharothrix australiensis]|uniref:Aryl-alcohol dehydrogenase-like predicted oxidoreductase n=1 Tax=Saccharothrix australiensis TaxID=2072 RepID=A0A495VZ32_9PSEU|nr:aldo/keto reductase [Saccharothrix australiensis]RKT54702.1 aryl-alcohol dehydrogenase-like predicted oxidoreductase [Saccharothrix australiensis]